MAPIIYFGKKKEPKEPFKAPRDKPWIAWIFIGGSVVLIGVGAFMLASCAGVL
jgi:hypothetical protein